MAAPKGDPGPPEQAQGNGPPAQAPAPQANGHAKQHAKGTTPTSRAGTHGSAGGNAQAHRNGRAGTSGHAGAGNSSSSHGQSGAHANVNSQEKSDNGHAGKETICHATHSDTNPYVGITVSKNAIPAHDRHQEDEDIIPAPSGGCPGGTPGTAGVGNPPSGIVSGNTGLAGAPEPAAGEAPAGGVMGVSEERGAPAPESAVQGAEQGGVEGATQVSDTSGSSLPFTGLGLGLLVALGALLALTGLLLRRRTTA